jgi:DNA-binding HxlR family transcriptional regulator
MRSDCPLNYGLEIFGDRWTLLIIRDLMFFGKKYYSETELAREREYYQEGKRQKSQAEINL